MLGQRLYILPSPKPWPFPNAHQPRASHRQVHPSRRKLGPAPSEPAVGASATPFRTHIFRHDCDPRELTPGLLRGNNWVWGSSVCGEPAVFCAGMGMTSMADWRRALTQRPAMPQRVSRWGRGRVEVGILGVLAGGLLSDAGCVNVL